MDVHSDSRIASRCSKTSIATPGPMLRDRSVSLSSRARGVRDGVRLLEDEDPAHVVLHGIG
jgi:hypothetical protein